MAKNLSNAIVRAVWSKTGGHCWYCGVQLERYHPGAGVNHRYGLLVGRHYFMEIDHAQPASRGGPSSLDNLLPACPRCNAEKNNRTVEEYRQDITRHINGVPKFREKQLRWLESNGFSFPHYPPHQFWGEKVQS